MLAYETDAFATVAEAKTKTKTFSLAAEARPMRLKFQPRRDRAEALLRLETALRPRYQDRVHIPAICCIQVQNTTSGPKITRDDSSARCPSVVAVSNIRTAGSRRH